MENKKLLCPRASGGSSYFLSGILKLIIELTIMQSKKIKTHSSGTVAGVVGGLVVGLVMLFVGLFMIDAVYNATYINSTANPLYSVQTNLVTLSGTVFSVLGLVIIIVALASAIGSLRTVTGGE